MKPLFFIPIVLWLVVALLLAPSDALRLWAGWFPVPVAPTPIPRGRYKRLRSRSLPPAAYYIVFLDGISKGTYRNLAIVDDFLTGLHEVLPDAAIVSDVLPYSVFNMSVIDERQRMSRFWSLVEGYKERDNPIGFLINIRNFLQGMVSADWRYGLAYNAAMSKLILFGLVRHGYDLNAPAPIVIIGYSGGGQVAAGAGGLLRNALAVPVHVVSLAGVMAGNAAFGTIDSWHQIVSNRDPVEKLGFIFFPMRWPIMFSSPWNQAKRQGRAHIVRLDGARHDKVRSYMDPVAPAPGGGTMLERTIATVAGIIRRELPTETPVTLSTRPSATFATGTTPQTTPQAVPTTDVTSGPAPTAQGATEPPAGG